MSPGTDKDRRALFSRELNRVINIIAHLREKTVESVERDISDKMTDRGFEVTPTAVTNWRLRGVVPQRAPQVALLAAYCVTASKGGLDENWLRNWANRVLSLANYPDTITFLATHFPAKPAHHNLPPRHGELIGRQADLRRLMEGLEKGLPVTCIWGMSGIGKSTLALEACYRCLPGPAIELMHPFSALVWISATDRPAQQRWLGEVLDTIARVSGYTPPVAFEEKLAMARERLEQSRTLLVIDSVETIDDPELYEWIEQVPATSKVLLVTSKRSQVRSDWLVELKGMAAPEAVLLIREHAHRLNLTAIERMDESQLRPLAEITEGNPKAIVLALGRVANGVRDLPAVVEDLERAGGNARDIFDELYDWHWETLGSDERRVLLAMSFFVEAVDGDALLSVAGLPDEPALTAALDQLLARSLLERATRATATSATPAAQGGNLLPISLHSLTRAFVVKRLAEDPTWEREARERWVAAYREFVSRHARRDPFAGSDEERGLFPAEPVRAQWRNLLQVTAWCAERDRYEDVCELWRADRMRVFANALGHWSDRVHWLEWLIEASERRDTLSREERAFVVDTMSALGWTLTAQRQLDAAARYLNGAWALREYVAPIVRSTLARHLAWLAMFRKQYDEALRWIAEHAALLSDPSIRPQERAREEIEALSYRGIICDEQHDYAKAEVLFREMLTAAEAAGWQRGCLDAHLLRAGIARKTGNYTAARRLLEDVLPRAERLGDRRVSAYYKRALAHLERAAGDARLADHLATEALDELQRLGLQSEVAELRTLRDECRAIAVPGSGGAVMGDQKPTGAKPR